MRENRTYGSEGGAAELNRPSLPLSGNLVSPLAQIPDAAEPPRLWARVKMISLF